MPQDAASPPSKNPAPPWANAAVAQEPRGLSKKLARKMMSAIEEWKLIGPGDRVMVALSGGKDSSTLFDLLIRAKKRAPFEFHIVGVHLDQTQPGYDGQPFYDWLEETGAPYEVHKEDTYSVVQEMTRPGQAYCVICSRLRRGILYTLAERLGCNKIALGHHRDDALETLMLNLLYAGRLQAMPATYTTDCGRFDVIRPLIECAEDDIRAYSEARAFPILPCNLCGSQDGLKRVEVKKLLSELEDRIPDVRPVMMNALRNIRPTHLLDADVGRAWKERADDIRPRTGMGAGERPQSEPVLVKKAGQLPIVS